MWGGLLRVAILARASAALLTLGSAAKGGRGKAPQPIGSICGSAGMVWSGAETAGVAAREHGVLVGGRIGWMPGEDGDSD
jgi:hypothetical protein